MATTTTAGWTAALNWKLPDLLLAPHATRAAGCLLAAAFLVLACSMAQAGDNSAQLEEGKQLFQKDAVPPCAICHALADAGSAGSIGPDLDELRPDYDQIMAALHDAPGAMPSFVDSLSEEQMEAVAAYIVAATRGD